MKNTGTFIIIALLLGFANLALASGRVALSVKAIDQTTFELSLENPKRSEVQVSLKDLSGISLHEGVYSQSEINLEFHLKALPLGSYVLVLKYEGLIQMQPISIRHDSLLIEPGQGEIIFPPQIDLSVGYLDIRMNCPESLSAYLEIRDEDGHVLYRRSARSKGEVQKRFNLKRLEKGEYQIALEIRDAVLEHRYTELISLSSEN